MEDILRTDESWCKNNRKLLHDEWFDDSQCVDGKEIEIYDEEKSVWNNSLLSLKVLGHGTNLCGRLQPSLYYRADKENDTENLLLKKVLERIYENLLPDMLKTSSELYSFTKQISWKKSFGYHQNYKCGNVLEKQINEPDVSEKIQDVIHYLPTNKTTVRAAAAEVVCFYDDKKLSSDGSMNISSTPMFCGHITRNSMLHYDTIGDKSDLHCSDMHEKHRVIRSEGWYPKLNLS